MLSGRCSIQISDHFKWRQLENITKKNERNLLIAIFNVYKNNGRGKMPGLRVNRFVSGRKSELMGTRIWDHEWDTARAVDLCGGMVFFFTFWFHNAAGFLPYLKMKWNISFSNTFFFFHYFISFLLAHLQYFYLWPVFNLQFCQIECTTYENLRNLWGILFYLLL